MRIESFPETNKDKNILEILREIIDRASEPMMAFDNKGIVVLINDTACDIIGHSSNECMHHDYRDLLTLTERPAFMESASKRGEVPELFNREEHFFEIYKISKYHIQNEEYITLSAIRKYKSLIELNSSSIRDFVLMGYSCFLHDLNIKNTY